MKMKRTPAVLTVLFFVQITTCRESAPFVPDERVPAVTLEGIGAGLRHEPFSFTISCDLEDADLSYSLDGGGAWTSYAGEVTVSEEGNYDLLARGVRLGDLTGYSEGVLVDLFYTEGSAANPVFLERNRSCEGYTDTGKSYYYTTGIGQTEFRITISGLRDDADLVAYDDDGSYTTVSTTVSGEFALGRYKDEFISIGAYTGNYYFVVDGADIGYHTAYTWTEYSINIYSSGNAKETGSGINEGSPEAPVEIRPWLLARGSVAESGTSYYFCPVESGVSYMVSDNGGVTLHVYSDSFTTELASFPAETASDGFYIAATDCSTNFTMIVVRDEGTAAEPVYLLTGKDNPCQAGSGSSYYLFEVEAGSSYDVVTDNGRADYYDVDLYVFTDQFTTSAGSSTGTGVSNETVSGVTATGSLLGVRVDEMAGKGAIFTLTVTKL